jgi:hypothetical protein
MNKLYIFREWNQYRVGVYDDIMCIANNIDDACKIISENMYAKYVNYDDGINTIKEEVKEFDLEIGFKKMS